MQYEQIINTFETVFDKTNKTKMFNLSEFYNLIEPQFVECGFRENIKSSQTNILIIHDAAVGDLIVESATIREIRRLYPCAFITMIVNSRAYDMAEFCPYIDEIIVNENNIKMLDLVAGLRRNVDIAKQLLPRQFHIAFAFNHYAVTNLLTYMSGAKFRIASRKSLDPALVYAVPNAVHCHQFASLITCPVDNEYTHSVDTCLSLVDYVTFAPVSNRSIEVWLSPRDRATAHNYIPNDEIYYAVGIGGSVAMKQYPPELYAELLKLIFNYDNAIKFIILGGKEDSESAQIIKSKFANVIDCTGKFNYRESVAIIERCKMYIGNDTGTLHAASALKIPILTPNCFPADFNMTNESVPKFWAPYKVPAVVVQPKKALPICVKKPSLSGCNAIHESHCIKQIMPETMFKAFLLLKEKISKNEVITTYFH